MKKEYYPSLKLELGKVSNHIQKEISEILGRKLHALQRLKATIIGAFA